MNKKTLLVFVSVIFCLVVLMASLAKSPRTQDLVGDQQEDQYRLSANLLGTSDVANVSEQLPPKSKSVSNFGSSDSVVQQEPDPKAQEPTQNSSNPEVVNTTVVPKEDNPQEPDTQLRETKGAVIAAEKSIADEKRNDMAKGKVMDSSNGTARSVLGLSTTSGTSLIEVLFSIIFEQVFEN